VGESAAHPSREVRGLAGLLPKGVAHVELYRPHRCETSFLSGERASLGRAASPGRQREFAVGRACARRALRELGHPADAIPRGVQGSPCWPAGFIGSITHTDGYCAAAVAKLTDFLALGIDAERVSAVELDLQDLICTERERRLLRSLGTQAETAIAAIFSAKESFYKAWFPLTKQWLGFLDVELVIDMGSGTFSPRCEGAYRKFVEHRFCGRFALDEGYVFAATVAYAEA
jgi:4'-phosphopantetheinyl transferase EntD